MANKEKGTYIYLYRKILNNKKLVKDTTAAWIFIWLLLRADWETGEVETGRYVMAHDLGINPNTLYSCLSRLAKNYKLVNIKSNNRFSTISIVNWKDFQSSSTPASTQASTSRQHQINTIQGSKGIKKESKLAYSPRIQWVVDTIGNNFRPTERTIRIIEEDFKDYFIDSSILRMVVKYDEVYKKPITSTGVVNWLLNAKKYGELERRDK